MNKKLSLLLGLVLCVGAFFYWKRQQTVPAESTEIQNLKPSQLDFRNGNGIQPPTQGENPSAMAAPLPTVPTQKLTAELQKKFDTFRTLLETKNDNDPKWDAELSNTPEAFHEALRDFYKALNPEKLNEKGSVNFLIARDMKSDEDAQFLAKVFEESPCLSLANCQHVSEDNSHETVVQTTLIYPQLTTLYQLEKSLRTNPERAQDPVWKNRYIDILRSAENFPVEVVQKRAAEIRKNYGL